MKDEVPTFDAKKFKDTTRQQWDAAAEAWDRWGGLLGRWLGPSTEMMLDMAGVKAGSHVLDVAAGAGEQTMVAARRVGPNGYILATDISEGILARASSNAKIAGMGWVETEVCDGEQLDDLAQGGFDAVISRVGLIYFPNQHKALTAMRGKLKQGGHVGAITYADASLNEFFSIPVGIIRKNAKLPPPQPGQPGPFSLGDPDVLRGRFEEAGFDDVQIERVDAPVRLTSALDCLQFEQESFGALHQMMATLSPAQQDDTWDEIEEALRQFETEHGFVGPCQMLVASGQV